MDNDSKEYTTDMKFESKKSSKKVIIICSLVALVLKRWLRNIRKNIMKTYQRIQ